MYRPACGRELIKSGYRMRYKKFFLGHSALLPILTAAVFLSGCLRDEADQTGPVVSGGGDVALSLSVPGMKVATRAGFPENAIEYLDIVVFNASGKFVEHIPARVIASELGGGSFTQAYAPLTATSNVSLVVIANARSRVEYWVRSLGTDFTKTQFNTKLDEYQGTDMLWNSKQVIGTGSESVARGLPMYGETGLIPSLPGPDGSIAVEMIRMHARIDITMEDASSDISELYFRYFNNFGYVSPHAAEFNVSMGGQVSALYKPQTAFSTAKEMFYVYESAAVDDNYYTTTPHLIVKAKWGGSYYFYRVNFVYDGTVDGTVAGQYMPVLRNHRYNVVIGSVDGPGYPTLNEADAASGEVTNLSYEILVSDESWSGNMVYDGNYWLSVDKTGFAVSKSGLIAGDYLEVAVRTNYKTSHTDGWKVSAADAGLVPYGESAMTSFGGAAMYDGKVRFTVSPNTGAADRDLTFTVTAGKLSQVVTVTQAGTASNAAIDVETLPGEILFHSWNGRLIEENYSQMFVDWTSVDGRLGVEVVGDTHPTGGYNHTYRPFQFLSSDGYDTFSSSATYTGWQELFRIGTEPVEYEYYTYPQRSIIRLTAAGDGGVVTRDVAVKHKNFYVFRHATNVMVASSDLSQSFGFEYNTNHQVTLADDPYGVLITPVGTLSHTVDQAYYDAPFDHSHGKAYGYNVQLNTKTTDDVGDEAYVRFRITSKPYPEYDGTITEYVNYPVIPVGYRANSYIVKPGVHVPAIPISQANRTAELGSNWIDLTRTITPAIEWSDTPGVVSNIYVTVSHRDYTATPEAYLMVRAVKEGNAVISVKQDGVVKWSWHIWVTADKEIIEAGSGSGKAWMQRNLGASQYTHGDALSHEPAGLRYIWGRKDPLPVLDTYYAQGRIYSGLGGKQLTTLSTLLPTIQDPLVFAAAGWEGSSQGLSWNDGSGAKTVYDPCPPGWKVPTTADFDALTASGFSYGAKGATADGVFFPLTGSRSADTFGLTTPITPEVGRYQSTDRLGYSSSEGWWSANFLRFNATGTSQGMTPSNINLQVAVRCVRD